MHYRGKLCKFLLSCFFLNATNILKDVQSGPWDLVFTYNLLRGKVLNWQIFASRRPSRWSGAGGERVPSSGWRPGRCLASCPAEHSPTRALLPENIKLWFSPLPWRAGRHPDSISVQRFCKGLDQFRQWLGLRNKNHLHLEMQFNGCVSQKGINGLFLCISMKRHPIIIITPIYTLNTFLWGIYYALCMILDQVLVKFFSKS